MLICVVLYTEVMISLPYGNPATDVRQLAFLWMESWDPNYGILSIAGEVPNSKSAFFSPAPLSLRPPRGSIYCGVTPDKDEAALKARFFLLSMRAYIFFLKKSKLVKIRNGRTCPGMSVEKRKGRKRPSWASSPRFAPSRFVKAAGCPEPGFHPASFLKNTPPSRCFHQSSLQGTRSPSGGFSMSGQATVKNGDLIYLFIYLFFACSM